MGNPVERGARVVLFANAEELNRKHHRVASPAAASIASLTRIERQRNPGSVRDHAHARAAVKPYN
jgi:hypothetical protein